MNKQTHAMSFVESCANVALGFLINIAAQLFFYPRFGIHVSLATNFEIAIAFTVASIARSFTLRRLFETLRLRSILT